MNTDDIEENIKKYHNYLDGFEKKENGDLPTEIVKLRHHVLFAHESIESLLHNFIIKNLIKSSDTTEIALSMYKISPVLEESECLPLLRACKKMGLITEKEFGKLSAVNNHRRRFAHPNAYRNEMKKYHNKDYYLQVLKELVLAWNAIISVADRLDSALKDNEKNEQVFV